MNVANNPRASAVIQQRISEVNAVKSSNGRYNVFSFIAKRNSLLTHYSKCFIAENDFVAI